MLIDCLKDVMQYVYGIGSFDIIKFNVKDDEVEIKTKDEKNTIVVYGKISKDLEEMKGEVGLAKLSLLKGFIGYSDFGDAEVKVQQEHEMPAKLVFNEKNNGVKSTYRFMSKDAVDMVMKVPNFKKVNWNLTIIPEKDAIDRLKYFHGIFSSFDDSGIFKTNNGKLELHIGGTSSDSTVIDFACNAKGTLNNTFSWPISQILSILRVYKNVGDVSMKISDAGALQISGKSGLGEYDYVLIGQRV